MAPTTLSVTVTASVTPPLGPDLAHQLGAEVAACVDGMLITRGDDDRGWHSWQFALDHDDDRRICPRVDDLELYLVTSIPAEHDVRATSLEALTMTEVNRRLAAHGVPAPGKVRRPTGQVPEIPRMPDVVTTAQFAEDVLGVDPSQVRRLRGESEKARAEGREHPFPAEFLPGYWLREDAERYARDGRRGPGRPPKARP